jgi:hypothetical protein
MFAGPAEGRNRTCVSGALQKADAIIAGRMRGVEIVIISDMLEDCDESLAGGRLLLEKRSIDEELARAAALPAGALLHLDGASVTAILPTVPTSREKRPHPPVATLKLFWRRILDHCGDVAENYSFDTEIPQRLADLTPREVGGL